MLISGVASEKRERANHLSETAEQRDERLRRQRDRDRANCLLETPEHNNGVDYMCQQMQLITWAYKWHRFREDKREKELIASLKQLNKELCSKSRRSTDSCIMSVG